MKSLTIVYLSVILTSLISCQKEKVEFPAHLIGEWESVDKLNPLKLILKPGGRFIFENASFRGEKSRIKTMDVFDFEESTTYYIVSATKTKSKISYSLLIQYYYESKQIVLHQHGIDTNEIFYAYHPVYLKKVL